MTLDGLRRSGELTTLDQTLASSLARLGGETRPEVLLAAALVSRNTGRGDVCLDLPRFVREDPSAWPPLDDWLRVLGDSPLVASFAGSDADSFAGNFAGDSHAGNFAGNFAGNSHAGNFAGGKAGDDAGDDDRSTPLVLDGRGRLFLRRCFEDERRVAAAFVRLATAPVPPFDVSAATEAIARLLPSSAGPSLTDGADGVDGVDSVDWQRVAAGVAVSKRLCVISGGPGTGKTTTAARLLAVLVEQELASGAEVPRIALAAPTGKAAARLGQAISRARGELSCSDSVRTAIPTAAATLHRLLGLGRGRLPASRKRDLGADVVLVDEASMIDLALMSRLVAALPARARLILLGDADQLASVEAGAVFNDLCGPVRAPGYPLELARRLEELAGAPIPVVGASASGVAECVVTLQRSHRYASDTGIGRLARAIRDGEAGAALAVLDDERLPDVTRVDASDPRSLAAALQGPVLEGYAPCLGADVAPDPLSRLRALDGFRVLCAVREGPFGAVDLNARIDAALVAAGLLAEPARSGFRGSRGEAAPPTVSPGRPILVTRNAPHLGLFNGDVGLLVEDPGLGVRAWFAAGDEPRSFGLSRLPPYEPVFAMTVHKSQGSEFDAVVLVLPDEPLPLLTRELIYTAVTRARSRVVVHASRDVLEAAIGRRVSRASGLRDALWPGAGDSGSVSLE